MVEMMMGANILEEVWWDGTDLTEVGNHAYFISEGETVYRIFTDRKGTVVEIEEA